MKNNFLSRIFNLFFRAITTNAEQFSAEDYKNIIEYRGRLEKGFTLLEVLIATVLFAMLIGVTSGALWKVLDTYQKKDILKNDYSDEFLYFSWVRQSLGGIMDYRVLNSKNKFVPFFEGKQKEMRYVSCRPILGTMPVLASLRVIRDEPSDASVALKYGEIEIYTKTLDEITDILSNQMLKMGNVRSCEVITKMEGLVFRYWGRQTASENEGKWMDEYVSLETGMLPEKIKIQYQKKGKRHEMEIPIYFRGEWKNNPKNL